MELRWLRNMGERGLVKLADFRLHKILEGPEAALGPEDNRQDLAYWIRRYLAERVAGVGSLHTWKAKARDLSHFYRFFIEWNRSAEITCWCRRDTETFREELLGQGYKPATVNRFLATVKHFGRYCEEQRAFAGECPVWSVKNVPYEALEPKGLDRFQVHRLLKSTEDLSRMKPGWEAARDQAIVHLLYAVGLRVTELCHLQVEHYDGQWLRSFPAKGGHFRDAYVPAQARAKLDGYLVLRQRAIACLCAKYEAFSEKTRRHIEGSTPWQRPDPRWLLLNRYASKVSRQHVHTLLRKVAEHARIHYGAEMNLYPHRLRHAFALEQLRKRGDPTLVAQLLGHRSRQHMVRYSRRREDEIAD